MNGKTRMTTDDHNEQIAARWLDILANQRFAEWETSTTEDLVVSTPYAPFDAPTEYRGRDVCRAMAEGYGKLLKQFVYRDIELHAAATPGLVFGTATSESTTPSDYVYRNRYSMIFRIRDSRICHYTEFFNPLVVMEAVHRMTVSDDVRSMR